MLRRIVGVTGISFWVGLIVIAVIAGFQTKADGEEMFKNLPEGWKIQKSFTASKEQTAAIGRKLGGRISKLTNTVLSIEGKQLQVNGLYCPTPKDAEKIYKAVLEGHNGLAASAALDGNLVVEFAKTDDVELMNLARRALGLPDARLDLVSAKVIKKIPAGWEVEKSFIVPPQQTLTISKKLGGRIKKLSNTIFSVQGKRFQVNVVECATPRAAEKIYNSILEMKPDPAFCLKLDNTVVEFVGNDVELAKRAPYELGFGRELEDTLEQVGQLDMNAKVAMLNIKTASRNRIIRIFGEPTKYVWGNEKFEKNNLPDRYIMVYPDGFRIFMMNGRIVELRHEGPDGYLFRGKLQVGSSLDEVLDFIGEPKKTLIGQAMPGIAEDGVLYKDINGEQGYCYYGRERKGVRFFFKDYKVTALYVTRNDLSGCRRSREEAKRQPATAVQTAGITAMARDFVNLLVNEDYDRAVERFDGTMKKALPAEKLQQVWDSIIAQSGHFVEQLGVRAEKIQQYDVVFVTCRFEKFVLDAKVVFNSEREISGLFFVPSQHSDEI